MKDQKDWESFYNRFSNIHVEEKHFLMAKFIKDMVTTASDIIDIGCGNGEYSIAFSSYFERVYAWCSYRKASIEHKTYLF